MANIATNYFLVNKPKRYSNFYPRVDINQRGEYWMGDRKPQASTGNVEPNISFFHYLHAMIWRHIVLREVDYEFHVDDACRQYSNHSDNLASSLPLLEMEKAGMFFNHAHVDQTVLTDNSLTIIREITKCKLTRYFLLLEMHKLHLDCFDFLSVVFMCLVGHQFSHLKPKPEYAIDPPPFKVVNAFGIAFDKPENSLETVGLYPCGIDRKDNIIFGSIYDSELLAVRGVTSNLMDRAS